jgi:hypothetical protein
MDEAERYRRALSYARGLEAEQLAELVAQLTTLLEQRRGEPDPEELLTLPEAAALAGLSIRTLHTQLSRGKLAGTKRGRDWYISRGDMGRYLAARDTRRGSYARGLPHDNGSETGA